MLHRAVKNVYETETISTGALGDKHHLRIEAIDIVHEISAVHTDADIITFGGQCVLSFRGTVVCLVIIVELIASLLGMCACHIQQRGTVVVAAHVHVVVVHERSYIKEKQVVLCSTQGDTCRTVMLCLRSI